MDYGFVRVAAAVPRLRVADCGFNSEQLIKMIRDAEKEKARIIVFPELSITACTCGDLFRQQALIREAARRLGDICDKTRDTGIIAITGLPVYADGRLFNCGAVIQRGRVLGVVPKQYIPGSGGCSEERWFAPGRKALSDTVVLNGHAVPFGTDLLFCSDSGKNVCFGLEIGEDLWAPVPPSSHQAVAGATLIFNLAAGSETVGKNEYRRELVKQQSARCFAGYVYSSAGVDESTTDMVFSGHSIIAENGKVIRESERFRREEQLIIADVDVERMASHRMRNASLMEIPDARAFRKIPFEFKEVGIEKLRRDVEPHPFVPADKKERDERCREIFEIQTAGLAKRLEYTGLRHAVVAVSGGLDATLALLVTAKTFDILGIERKNIKAVTMPGFGTTSTTYGNAIELIRGTGADLLEIDIKAACLQHFKDIGHDPGVCDVTYENAQARERTQIVMDIANKTGALAIGTGDLSELALGWCTYNGDHMSMYGVNSGVPKTLVIHMVRWAADNMADGRTREVLLKILNTPITPELLPPDAEGRISQRTEDIIGPYELHDFFLYHVVRYGAPPAKVVFLAAQAFEGKYDRNTIKKWLTVFYKRFFSQQYKRSCLPDGPKVGTVGLSPRGDWRMPSDAEAKTWLDELENIVLDCS